MHQTLPLDTTRIPFTAPESFLTFSWQAGAGIGGRIFYRTCSRRAFSAKDLPFWAHDFFHLALMKNGRELPYTYQATPVELRLTAGEGTVSLVFSDPDTVVFEADGVDFSLLPAKAFSNFQRKARSHNSAGVRSSSSSCRMAGWPRTCENIRATSSISGPPTLGLLLGMIVSLLASGTSAAWLCYIKTTASRATNRTQSNTWFFA